MVENEVFPNTALGTPSSTGFVRSANQISDGAGLNCCLGQNEVSGSLGSPFGTAGSNSFYQQQLIQTQKMFIDQQASMKSLTETVQKLQQQMNRSASQQKRKHHEISDSSDSSEVESGQYISSEDEESFDNTSSKALPVSSVERKKERKKS